MSRFSDALRREAAEDGEVPSVVEKIAKGKKLKKKLKKKAKKLEADDGDVAPADGAHFKEAILADQRERALSLGEEFWNIESEVRLLKERLGKIGTELFPLVKALGGEDEELVLPDGRRVVITTTGGGRRATMGSIVERWGEEGKAFWNALKPGKGYERLEARGPRDGKSDKKRPKP